MFVKLKNRLMTLQTYLSYILLYFCVLWLACHFLVLFLGFYQVKSLVQKKSIDIKVTCKISFLNPRPSL